MNPKKILTFTYRLDCADNKNVLDVFFFNISLNMPVGGCIRSIIIVLSFAKFYRVDCKNYSRKHDANCISLVKVL